MTKGIIIKINKAIYFVKLPSSQVIECSIRGKIINSKVLPIVGDFCDIDENTKTINSISERKNSLVRPEVSNVDKLFIVCSTKIPRFSSYLLDKFLVLAHVNKIEPIVIFTKMDLLKFKEKGDIKKYIKYYKKLGYKVYKNTEISKIKKEISGSVVALAGQTGAGKSSLLNRLDKSLDLKTDEISLALGRGKHTTRLVELLDSCNGLIADTPGFSSLELDIDKSVIKKGYAEFKNNCKYKSCSHIKEKGCTVKEDVQKKKIADFRYENYLKLMGELK